MSDVSPQDQQRKEQQSSHGQSAVNGAANGAIEEKFSATEAASDTSRGTASLGTDGARNTALPPADSVAARLMEEGQIIEPPEKVYGSNIAIETLSNEELSRSEAIYNRELNWLDFNWRVLYEALDERTPLLERLRFIAITASNLDEFFRKRVGGLKRQSAAGIANLTLSGWTPDEQLELISRKVRPMVAAQSDCLLDEILPALGEHGVHLRNYGDLDKEEQTRLHDYYLREIYPILTPLGVDPGHPFPFISNMSLSLAVLMRDPANGETRFARVKVPLNRSRWVQLSQPLHFIPLEQIIAANLDVLFTGMEVLDAYPFRVTRNADIARNEEEADDLLEMINEELRERRFASVVRLEVAEEMPEHLRTLLRQELHLQPIDVYPVRGPLRQADFFGLADVGLPHLKYEPWTPLTLPRLKGISGRQRPSEIFSIIRQGDLLVHHPYHSFPASTQQFIEAAANDPQVLAIKQTLYRTSSDSPIAKALIHAAESGKQVAVLVELKARFDEAQNIEWARTLENAGCHVAYGLVGLKTHSKVSLVIRQEEDRLRAYFHIGTGNYNPKTANLYTDLGLLSCRPDLGADLMDLFNFLTGYSRQLHYRKLLVAPVNMRQQFLDLIDTEIANVLAGRKGRVIVKLNGLDDSAMVQKLYEASQAGVQIDLIVRGVCRVRAGVPGISENIRVISIIGRFLEHSRLYCFENDSSDDSQPHIFFGSADWMSRNLSNRVEAVTPVEEESLRSQITFMLDTMLRDQRQAWELLPDGRYRKLMPEAVDEASDGLSDEMGTRRAEVDGAHEVLMEYTRGLSQRRAA